ncbi:MAG: hypothetical protein ACYDCP_02785 [Thermoplasmataceae archaeon]
MSYEPMMSKDEVELRIKWHNSVSSRMENQKIIRAIPKENFRSSEGSIPHCLDVKTTWQKHFGRCQRR